MYGGFVDFILLFPPANSVDPKSSPAQYDSSVGQQQNTSVFADRSALFRGIGAHKIHEEIKAFSSEAVKTLG